MENKKKWISFSVLVLILIMVAVIILAIVLEAPAAYARGGIQRSCLEGFLIGGCLGLFLGRSVDAQPAYAPPPPPPPPRTCQRLVEEHWETRWNSDGTRTQWLVPKHWEPYPCR